MLVDHEHLLFILEEYAYLQPSFCLYSWVVLKVTPYQYPWDEISSVESNDKPNGHGNPFSDANCCCLGIKNNRKFDNFYGTLYV